jgi:NADP-dependent 3-hydroxy acid dehydrogenase YdfG
MIEGVEFLKAEDVAQGILWTLAQPERINVNEVLFRPTDQRDW